MAKLSLAELKAQYKADTREPTDTNTPRNNYYPFWDMPIGARAVVRFLPDLNDSNPRGFLVEKVFHTLIINGEKKTVPCLSMYEEDCPICKVSSAFYKEEDKVNGKAYWRKKQYIGQVIVVEDPIEADKVTGETHTGKVRFINLGWQIYNIIKEAFAGDDLDDVPYNFSGGYDFIIKKTAQGEYSSYAVGTKFANKPRDLTEEELAAAEEGMVDLSTLLPRNIGVEKTQGMLNAALTGTEYNAASEAGDDDDSQAEFSAPMTTSAPAKPAATKSAPAPVAKPAPKAETSDDEEVVIDDVLAKLRARRQAAK